MAARRPQRHGRRDREGGRRRGCGRVPQVRARDQRPVVAGRRPRGQGAGRRLRRPDGSELIRIERAGPSTKGESGSLI